MRLHVTRSYMEMSVAKGVGVTQGSPEQDLECLRSSGIWK